MRRLRRKHAGAAELARAWQAGSQAGWHEGWDAGFTSGRDSALALLQGLAGEAQ